MSHEDRGEAHVFPGTLCDLLHMPMTLSKPSFLICKVTEFLTQGCFRYLCASMSHILCFTEDSKITLGKLATWWEAYACHTCAHQEAPM